MPASRLVCLVLSALVAGLTGACRRPAAAAAPPPTPPTPLTFSLSTGRVEVGGYHLQYACWGTGTPTVMVEDALGVSTLESGNWWAVMEQVAPLTRFCVYDRAGLGLSEAALGQPRTSQHSVQDLHALLTGARLPGPYVLVGHGLGGLNALLYAHDYPSEVAGLVLVNATHPAHYAELLAALPPAATEESAALRQLRDLPAAPAANPEGLDVLASAEQVQAALGGADQPLGELPLVVLTRSPDAPLTPFLPPELAAWGTEVWHAQQTALAGLSAQGVQVFAAAAGHNVQIYEPELVSNAIRDVLNEIEN